MSSDLLSGPDLGAGYLHQLSIDRETESRFTYHAQEGGLDANGPPKGPLAPIGFVHPSTACQFGGSRCWHRRFLLPESEAAIVRATYNRHRFVLQATLDQLFSDAPIPVESALKELLDRIDAPLGAEGTPFYFMGSVATRLQGVMVRPRDIDLGTTEAGVTRIGELLKDYLIEPVAATDWPGTGSLVGGRAFVGSLTSGMRVEWAAPRAEEPESDLVAPNAGRWSALAPLETVELGDRRVRASRLEFAAIRSAERKDWERLARIGERLKVQGLNLDLFQRLVEESKLSEIDRTKIREAVSSD